MLNLLLLAIPNGSNSPDPFTRATDNLTKNAKLTKGHWFLVVPYLLLLGFTLSYSLIPQVNDAMPIPGGDIRIAFGIYTGVMILYGVLYNLPDIIQKFKDIK